MPYAGVYSKVSAAVDGEAHRHSTRCRGADRFRGTTLRGLLLEAYGFSILGVIAMWAAIASFVLAGVMAVLVGFGFWHSRRVPVTEEILAPRQAGQAHHSLTEYHSRASCGRPHRRPHARNTPKRGRLPLKLDWCTLAVPRCPARSPFPAPTGVFDAGPSSGPARATAAAS